MQVHEFVDVGLGTFLVPDRPRLVARRDAVFVAAVASNLETPHRPVFDQDRADLATARGHYQVSVFDGGPDTCVSATSGTLAVGR